MTSSNTVYDFKINAIDGKPMSMDAYRGKVLLIVNTASACGFTPQYKGLEELYQKYKEQGLVVLGFPCNQFGEQEPGTEQQIVDFCEMNYRISFPMFEKVDVNGPDAHPLYEFLKKEEKGFLGTEGIKWNFTKFLVSREGKVLSRYGSVTKPEAIAKDVEKALH